MHYPLRIFGVTPPTSAVEGAPQFTSEAWGFLSIMKETSGLVSIGTNPSISPPDRSTGGQLPVDMPLGPILVGPGTKIYLVSDTIEHVLFMFQQIPEDWVKSGDIKKPPIMIGGCR